jgi:hypothetical protein
VVRRILLTAAWLGALAVFFRWWDLTSRVPPLAVWSCLFLAAFAVTLVVARGRAGLEDAAERGRMMVWAALILLAAAGNFVIPQVQIRDAMVRTVVFVKVLDTVVPLWIAVRAVIATWTGTLRWITLAGLPLVLAAGLWFFVVDMPGRSYAGALPPLTAAESLAAGQLERDVRRLVPAGGERNHRFPAVLDDAARYVDSVFRAAGHQPVALPYAVGADSFRNLEITIMGTSHPGEILVIGAHFDAAEGAPGADDNASGTAALLGLARALAGRRFARTVRLVAFTNEEPPFFSGPDMGSRVYAARAAQRGDNVVAMVSLETLGYYDETPGSQRYPPPFNLIYPDRGDFLGFVGNMDSRPLVRRAIATFRRSVSFPSEGVAAPALIPGIAWSDHEAFWRHGWQAIMITDTAPFRNPHYHQRTDTADRLDYRRMARVLTGLQAVVEDLAGAGS